MWDPSISVYCDTWSHYSVNVAVVITTQMKPEMGRFSETRSCPHQHHYYHTGHASTSHPRLLQDWVNLEFPPGRYGISCLYSIYGISFPAPAMEAEPVLFTAHLSITGYESERVGIRDLPTSTEHLLTSHFLCDGKPSQSH